MPLTFGELFAGIGGFSLGLERAGMTCKWQVEIDPYARAVLSKHWPDVPRHDDVRTFPPQGDYSVDLICGGFPCQDISLAGRGAGLAGQRSGLWYEFARIIGEVRPRYVIVENVAALLVRGMGSVVGSLSSLGYDAEWHVIPASAVGAPHRRERVWIVAYANGEGLQGCCETSYSERRDSKGFTRQSASDGGARRWPDEPDVGRVAHGIPARVDRLKCLGNAVVPQVVELIGRAIIQADSHTED